MRHNLFATILVMASLCVVPSAVALGEGTAVGVDPDAVARVQSRERVLQVGTDVSVGETIVTGSAGQVQIVFDDSTRLVVGPGSSLLVETYLLTSSNRAQKLTVNALGGTFRFITGNSAKSAYSIRTPTAAIAVRGTEFDLVVDRNSTKVMLYDGALEVCNGARECAELDRRCDLVVARAQQVAVLGSADAERAPASLQFRYARFQGKLMSDFKVSGAGRCIGEPSSNGSPESLSTTTGADDTTPSQRFPTGN
jgi:hypothetical protein